ncbi:MAG: biotin/lipoyl-binding protein, partial [Pseudomonadota bacterium]
MPRTAVHSFADRAFRAPLRGVALGLVAALSFTVWPLEEAGAQGRAARVETHIIATATMSETVTVFGQVVAQRESSVAARVGGLVVNVPISVGDRVSEGDVLA